MSKRLIIIFTVIGFLLFGTVLLVSTKGLFGENKNATADAEIVSVVRGDIESVSDLSGFVRANPRIDLLSEVTGTVKKVYVSTGDSVSEGDSIVDIELPSFIYGYRRTITVASPIDGKVLIINTSKGDTLFPHSSIAVIGDSEHFIAKFYADEMDAVNIKKGQKAILSFDAFPHLKIESKVEFVSDTTVLTKRGVRAFVVEVNIPNEKGVALKDGLSVSVNIITARKSNVLLVPVESVGSDENGSFVDLIVNTNDGKKIKKVYIETGISSDNFTEVVKGLKEGDEILKTPVENLFNDIGVKAPFGMLNDEGN